MTARMPDARSDQEAPHGHARHVVHLGAEAWVLVLLIGCFVRGHIGDGVEVIIVEGTQPVYDGLVNGVGIRYSISTCHSCGDGIGFLARDARADPRRLQTALAVPPFL